MTTVAKSNARQTAVATNIIAGIAVLALLFSGRVVFMPIVLALTLTTVFRPIVRLFDRLRIPPIVSAPVVVLTAIVLVVVVGRLLVPSVRSFGGQLPKAVAQARSGLQNLPRPFNGLAASIPDMGQGNDSAAAAPTDSSDARPDSVKKGMDQSSRSATRPPQPGIAKAGGSGGMGSIIARVFGTATELVTDTLQTGLLLIFFLIGSDGWHCKLMKQPAARPLLEIGDKAQQVVSRYLVMTALINVGQGILVSLAAWAIGLPSPPIWGVLTFIAEFIPYMGGLAMVSLLLLVGLSTSQGIGHALLGPASYLLITTVQNNVVSPVVYGRGLELNPAAILVSVILWFFLWGVGGAFLAVPILAIIKLICERQGAALGPVLALIEE